MEKFQPTPPEILPACKLSPYSARVCPCVGSNAMVCALAKASHCSGMASPGGAMLFTTMPCLSLQSFAIRFVNHLLLEFECDTRGT